MTRQHQQPEHDLQGPRADEEAEEGVDDVRDDQDLEQVPPAGRGERQLLERHYRPPRACATVERLARGRDVVHPEQPRASLPRERAGGGGRAVASLDRLAGDGAEESLARRADQHRAPERLQGLELIEQQQILLRRSSRSRSPGSITVAAGATPAAPARPSASRSSADHLAHDVAVGRVRRRRRSRGSPRASASGPGPALARATTAAELGIEPEARRRR